MPGKYDVVIIGAGIHGAGVAQAAAARGYSVLVLEQTGIAGGTSSRSSKLIHGGLRYLETGQFSLVRESLRERQLMLELAPDLVRLVRFYIPVYKSTRRRPWQLRAGLSLYAMLGGLGKDNRFSVVSRPSWGHLDGLDTRELQAVYSYLDGQTDDALLTRAVMRSAQSLGARLLMPAVFTGAESGTDGVAVEYLQDGNRQACLARVLVNAAGPWVNQVLERIKPAISAAGIDLVRGTHIRVSGIMRAGIYYMETPQDARAVFAMPEKDTILVGTTEAFYTGDPAAVQPTLEEQAYLLDVLAHYFPAYQSPENRTIRSSFAGLRVLPEGTGRAFQRKRETLLVTDRADNPCLLSIYGGKLTTWRATADKVMQRLAPGLPARQSRARTDQLALSPG